MKREVSKTEKKVKIKKDISKFSEDSIVLKDEIVSENDENKIELEKSVQETIPVINEEKLKIAVEKTVKKEIVVMPTIKEISETVEGEILLKNTGGSFHMGRRKIIKPGEKFKAKWSDIPVGFRDTIYPLEDVPVTKSAPLVVGKKAEFEVFSKGEKEEDGYDVINKTTGKKINGLPLIKVVAEKMVEDLNR